MHTISRRKFIALSTANLAVMPMAGSIHSAASAVTAQQVVDRVKKNLESECSSETLDGFKAGDPETIVTGIVTTSLASLEVLGKAVKAGANMIVTCEPTFFSKADSMTPPVRRRPGTPAATTDATPPRDPVFISKADFIRDHNLVVWRFSDHWRRYKPDAFSRGLGDTLGWSKFAQTPDFSHFTLPEISLVDLASHIKKSLNSRGGMRIVGDPGLRVRRIALLPGFTAIQASIETLPNVDAIVAGEVREWESVEYVRDTVDLGGKKSLILVGRIVSEGPGMRVCAEWLKRIVPEVDSMSILSGDPYWRPKA
jgi:putative NIF3 family GTP cyclohydrolase 1 type 2